MLLFLGGILAITFIRMVMGLIGKAVGDLVTQPKAGSPAAATRGALKKCAVCGIHAPPHSSRGELHYCSPECAAKA
ncbi:MAG: hypothetical protein K2X03_00415 [Bryobacteraceae bacterium]|nr:hypothetical protein [Bryobacteraceae bacterium]